MKIAKPSSILDLAKLNGLMSMTSGDSNSNRPRQCGDRANSRIPMPHDYHSIGLVLWCRDARAGPVALNTANEDDDVGQIIKQRKVNKTNNSSCEHECGATTGSLSQPSERKGREKDREREKESVCAQIDKYAHTHTQNTRSDSDALHNVAIFNYG